MAQLAKKWVKVHTISGLEVIMFGQRNIVDGVRTYTINIITDLLMYNIGSITFSVNYDRWLTQSEFDVETSLIKAHAALIDMVNEYNNQMKQGTDEPVEVTYEK
jgi:hypothetical protein